MKILAITLLLAGCGVATNGEPPDLGYAVKADLSFTGDLATRADLCAVDLQDLPTPDLAQPDLRQQPDLAEVVTPSDMTAPAPDLGQICGIVDHCDAIKVWPNGTHCCNGAACINGYCWNPPGDYCCIGACDPIVACWQSAAAGASGVCGVNNKCQ